MGKDSVSFFRLQLAAGHIRIINIWTFGVLNEKVSFPLSISTSVLSPTLCAMHIASVFLPLPLLTYSQKPPTYLFLSTGMWNLTSFLAFAVLKKIIWLPGYTEGAQLTLGKILQSKTHLAYSTTCVRHLRSRDLRPAA